MRLLCVASCLRVFVDLDPEDERLLEDDMGAPSDAKRFVPLVVRHMYVPE